ncbi:hypothetical protein QBK99_05365 [Corticibacterium sp. UT-5YL-CI-8]|nr:hypothetical protein [Tianweitania sp. UT-5YL-CI-8]
MNVTDTNTTAAPCATVTTWATVHDLARQLSSALAEVDDGTWCAYVAPATDGKTHVAMGLLGDDNCPLETVRRMRKGVPA